MHVCMIRSSCISEISITSSLLLRFLVFPPHLLLDDTHYAMRL